MSSRILAMATVTVVVMLSFLGCGDEPQFDPATKYTPETLAQELVFRYKSLDKPGVAVPADKPEGPAEKGEAAARKGVDATKAAPANTLDGLLKDISLKAASIPGLSPAQASGKVAEIAVKDPAISEADKKIIAERLGK